MSKIGLCPERPLLKPVGSIRVEAIPRRNTLILYILVIVSEVNVKLGRIDVADYTLNQSRIFDISRP